MMEIRDLISSGKLELYVYGVLPDSESAQITRLIGIHSELKQEVEEIERALIILSGATAPSNLEVLYPSIRKRLKKNHLISLDERKKTNWKALLGWAATLLLIVGLFFMFNKNKELQESFQALERENTQIQAMIVDARIDAEKAKELLNVIRDRKILKVSLPGQKIAPKSLAVVYWNKDKNITYIDVKDLPTPPKSMVYQVWSLTMEPLTPTSIGLLNQFEQNENKIFELKNPNKSEGFGITLEPEGGSETPTMERLYSLGTVSS